jgi:hypothetical protein
MCIILNLTTKVYFKLTKGFSQRHLNLNLLCVNIILLFNYNTYLKKGSMVVYNKEPIFLFTIMSS